MARRLQVVFEHGIIEKYRVLAARPAICRLAEWVRQRPLGLDWARAIPKKLWKKDSRLFEAGAAPIFRLGTSKSIIGRIDGGYRPDSNRDLGILIPAGVGSVG